MDIVVKGRNVEVPDHYRQLTVEKLGRVERYDQKLIRIDVELIHEPNRRQSASCERIEITCKSRGPVIRSEASADTFYAALDLAVDKLQSRLRRSADRRRVHRGQHAPKSVAAATSPTDDGRGRPAQTLTLDLPAADEGSKQPAGDGGTAYDVGLDDNLPGRIVREKEHTSKPMSVDEALFEMELVGHDFFLFAEADTGRAAVVYRRKGYDYGVIRLAE